MIFFVLGKNYVHISYGFDESVLYIKSLAETSYYEINLRFSKLAKNFRGYALHQLNVIIFGKKSEQLSYGFVKPSKSFDQGT